MSYLSSNPRIAWAMAFESGIRTQACADLAEIQQAQPKKAGRKNKDQAVPAKETRVNKGGAGAAHGIEYMAVYSAIKRMEHDSPLLAAVGHWLSLADTGAANQYLDDVAEAILVSYIAKTPEWSSYRSARKERVEALIQAHMMQDRNDMDSSRPLWQPKEVCFYCREFMGVKIVAKNWLQDGWHKEWSKIGDILASLESAAMEPIYKVIKETNKLYKKAA
ncbi:hypothetical protein Q8G38_16105 [Halomonas venusta]|uniref:hypothetical protein n=1 Tax=Vreelandella venusta TaxID=44935 RepID=UPI00295E81FB|nr:hypothetical protein [Halomonas venusta]MDW0360837.1 hypothetical protein [Halomonas venusta]